MAFLNKMSKIFGPKFLVPLGSETKKEFQSKSLKLFSEFGIAETSNAGFPILFPIGMRSLTKLKNLVRREMVKLSAQEMSLPTLTPTSLFKKTGRLDSKELFIVLDRHDKAFLLSPTHEESVTDMLSSNTKWSYRTCPLRLFQISSKFRDEMRPKLGLLRGREFLMKDLYCFDVDAETSKNTYDEVTDCYHNLFCHLQVPYAHVKSQCGDIGGSLSHEFHFLTDVGEDTLLFCNDCHDAQNLSLSLDKKHCSQCQSENVTLKSGMEVGHTFLLESRYSEPLKAQFVDSQHKLQFFQMSCFGLGLTRIIAAAVEALSTSKEITWPLPIAPFTVCLLPPKAGSKEEKAVGHMTELICASLDSHFRDDFLLDDRTSLTLGNRLVHMKMLGLPYVVIIGKSAAADPPLIEVIDVKNQSTELININDVAQFILNKVQDRYNSNADVLHKVQSRN